MLVAAKIDWPLTRRGTKKAVGLPNKNGGFAHFSETAKNSNGLKRSIVSGAPVDQNIDK